MVGEWSTGIHLSSATWGVPPDGAQRLLAPFQSILFCAGDGGGAQGQGRFTLVGPGGQGGRLAAPRHSPTLLPGQRFFLEASTRKSTQVPAEGPQLVCAWTWPPRFPMNLPEPASGGGLCAVGPPGARRGLGDATAC